MKLKMTLEITANFKTSQLILIISRHAENGIPPGLSPGPLRHPGSIPGDGVIIIQKAFSTMAFLQKWGYHYHQGLHN